MTKISQILSILSIYALTCACTVNHYYFFGNENVAQTDGGSAEKVNAELIPEINVNDKINTENNEKLADTNKILSEKNIKESLQEDISENNLPITASLFMDAIPVATNKIIGSKATHLATAVADASKSKQDIRYDVITISAGTCGCWNGAKIEDFENYKLLDEQNNQVGNNGIINIQSNQVLFDIPNGYLVKKFTMKKLKIVADELDVSSLATTCFSVVDGKATAYPSKSNVYLTFGKACSPAQTWIHVGQLRITLDPSNPEAKQCIAGTENIVATVYKACAYFEDISIESLGAWVGNSQSSSVAAEYYQNNLKKIVLVADEKPFSNASFSSNGCYEFNVHPKTLVVKKDNCIKIELKVSLYEKKYLVSGSKMYVGIADSNKNGAEWGSNGSYSIVARGITSNILIPANNINSVGNVTGNVYGGNLMELYDGVLKVSLAPNTPAGPQYPGVSRDVIILSLTAMGADITINNLEYQKSGFCTVTGLGPANWLSSSSNTQYYYWTAGTSWLNNGRMWTGGVIGRSLVIPEGSTVNIRLNGDTSGCVQNSTLQYSVKGNMLISGIVWSDGDAQNVDSLLTEGLPLIGKPLTY